MNIKHYEDVKEEQVTKANSKKTTIRWLITDQDGAENFTMRRFEIKPGGEIGIHEHPEEHEIFILSGKGTLVDQNGAEKDVKAGDVVFVPPGEPHGYKNKYNEPFAFLCVIPYL